MKSVIAASLLVIVTISLLLFNGCGDSLPTMEELNSTNMRRLHSAYRIYMNSNEFKGPTDKEDLIDFLTNNNTARVLLKRMNVSPEQLPGIFVSERDGEPFKVRYGLTGVADHAIVFESVGVEGKRLVAFSKPRELDETEYEGYWSGDIKPEAPAEGPGGGAAAPEAAINGQN